MEEDEDEVNFDDSSDMQLRLSPNFEDHSNMIGVGLRAVKTSPAKISTPNLQVVNSAECFEKKDKTSSKKEQSPIVAAKFDHHLPVKSYGDSVDVNFETHAESTILDDLLITSMSTVVRSTAPSVIVKTKGNITENDNTISQDTQDFASRF